MGQENTCLKDSLGGTTPERTEIPNPTKVPKTPDFNAKVSREKAPLDLTQNWAKIVTLWATSHKRADAENKWANLQDHKLESQRMQSELQIWQTTSDHKPEVKEGSGQNFRPSS